jgi:hypothetical protein
MSTTEPHLDPDRDKEASGQIWIYSAIHFFRAYQLLAMLFAHSCIHKLRGCVSNYLSVFSLGKKTFFFWFSYRLNSLASK